MNHLSDKELDRLSKEAAEQYDAGQNTSGWDQLQHKLDKELPIYGREKRRRFLFFLIFFVLLTGGGLIYFYITSPRPSDKLVNNTIFEKQVIPPNPVPVPSNNRADNPKITNRNDYSIKNEKNKVTHPLNELTESGKNQSIKLTDKASRKPLHLNHKKNPSTKIKSTWNAAAPNSNREVNKTTGHDNQQKKAADSSVIISNIREATNDLINNSPSTETLISLPDKINTPKGIDSTNDQTVSVSKYVTENKMVAIEKEKKVTKGKVKASLPFTVGMIAGTDYSNVKFTHNDKPGYNFGVILSWQFSKRFSLNTGAVYAKKNYSANGNDFHPPKGYWTNNIKINEVIGSCWMIDIPLDMRVDIHSGKSGKWFVSSGVSTYLMKKEEYDYHYMYYGTYTVRNWTNDKNSNYIFSVGNLSAGYEKLLSNHLSVQAEPYLKIPLKGVGFGKMQMNSYGLNVSIRYGFSVNKKAIKNNTTK